MKPIDFSADYSGVDERYWDNLAGSYTALVHDSLACDRGGVIEGWLDALASSRRSAADFGCGIGRYLPALAPRFKTVHALDHSRNCLEQARCEHAELDNIIYRKADLRRALTPWKSVDVGICMNVLIAPDVEISRAIMRTMAGAIKSGGTLLAVAPSLESALFTNQRLTHWNVREGMSRRIAERRCARDGVIGPIVRGVVSRGGVPTKHYLLPELELLLRQAGFTVRAVERIEYDWDVEFDAPPAWMTEPYPWHWMLACEA